MGLDESIKNCISYWQQHGNDIEWHDSEIENIPLNEPLAVIYKNNKSGTIQYWLTFCFHDDYRESLYWLRKDEFFIPPLPKKQDQEVDPVAIAKKIMEEDENISSRASVWAKYGQRLLDLEESDMSPLIYELLTYVYVLKFMR